MTDHEFYVGGENPTLLRARYAGSLQTSATTLPAPVLWLGVLNAVACTFAPVVMIMLAIERIGSAATAQAGMLGPVTTVALGALLLD